MKLNPFILVTAFVILVSKPFKFIYDKLFPIGYEDETGFHYGNQKGQG